MVAVAQLVESRIVIPVVVGSNPISHPILGHTSCCAFDLDPAVKPLESSLSRCHERARSLSSEDTSSSTLAGDAMTDRDPNRVGCDVSLKLATTARCGSISHRSVGGD